jgi:hypothetical protein
LSETAGDDQPQLQPSCLGRIIGLAVFSVLFGGSAARIVPGGPFVSLTGDILPTIAAVVSIRYSLLTLRGRDIGTKAIAVTCVVVCTFALSNVFRSVLSFWFRPYARGDFFGL